MQHRLHRIVSRVCFGLLYLRPLPTCVSAFGFAGLSYPTLRSLGGVVNDYWALIWVGVV